LKRAPRSLPFPRAFAPARRGLVGSLAAALSLSLAVATPLGAPRVAWAGDGSEAEIAAARQLFKEGKDLEAEDRWAEALERFEKVAAVKMTPQVRFHMALCHENLGRLVAAINGFELAGDEARRAGKGAEDVAENAPKRAAALRARVAKLEVHVTGTILQSKVLLDGEPVPKALYGTAIPVDPGAHKIELDTDGTITFRKDVTLQEGESQPIAIEVRDVEKVDEPPPPPPPPPPPADEGMGRIPAYAAAGVGVLALGGAGVFLGLRESTLASIRENCPTDTTCDSRYRDDIEAQQSDGKTYTTAANVLLGVGAAGLVTAGVLWFVLAPEEPASSGSTSVSVAPAGPGVVVSGRF
jgi:hypothetical protein